MVVCHTSVGPTFLLNVRTSRLLSLQLNMHIQTNVSWPSRMKKISITVKIINVNVLKIELFLFFFPCYDSKYSAWVRCVTVNNGSTTNLPSARFMLVCYTAVFSVVTQRSSPLVLVGRSVAWRLYKRLCSRLGLCRHNFGHNAIVGASSIVPA